MEEKFYENRYEDPVVKEQILPQYEKGDALTISVITQTCHQLKPPHVLRKQRFSSAMENPVKYMGIEWLADTLKSTGGLGTGSERVIFDKLLLIIF